MQLPKIVKKQSKVRSSAWGVLFGAVGLAVSVLGMIPKQFQNSEIVFGVVFLGALYLLWKNKEKGGENNGNNNQV